MKKQTLFGKIIAVALVAVMIMSILPITAAAAPSGYQSGDLLVKMDAFNANTVVSKYEGVTVTNQTSYNANRGADYGEDFTEIIGRGAGTDNSYVGGVVLKTNLPLDATSQYTIVFDIKNTSGSALFFGPAMQAQNPIYGTHLLFSKDAQFLTTRYYSNPQNPF